VGLLLAATFSLLMFVSLAAVGADLDIWSGIESKGRSAFLRKLANEPAEGIR
jgi:hypothetical protein